MADEGFELCLRPQGERATPGLLGFLTREGSQLIALACSIKPPRDARLDLAGLLEKNVRGRRLSIVQRLNDRDAKKTFLQPPPADSAGSNSAKPNLPFRSRPGGRAGRLQRPQRDPDRPRVPDETRRQATGSAERAWPSPLNRKPGQAT